MQKKFKFEKLTKIPGTSKLVQGVKNGCRPPNAVAGGNGSFIVAERSKLILAIRGEDGTLLKKDIYCQVKSWTNRRLTNLFCEQLEAMFKSFDFLVENDDIINLDKLLVNLD